MSSATVNAPDTNNMNPMHSEPEKGIAMETQVEKVSPLYHARRGILVFLKYFSLVFITFCILLPLVSCVWTAAKTDAEYKTGNVMAMPHNWFNFSNYVEAFKLSNMAVAFRNSFIVLVCVCFMTTIIGTQLAYVLSRFQFPGNAFIRGAFTIAALLPGIAMQVAVYKIMGSLGMINSLWGYIIMSMGTDVISIYIFIQYFENLPISLDEAAMIDGASYFTIYGRILLPAAQAGHRDRADSQGRRHLQRVLCREPVPARQAETRHGRHLAIRLYRPARQQIQPDLRRRDRDAAARPDPVPDLPEADLQRRRRRRGQGVIRTQ